MEEIWLYHYDADTKQQSIEWRHSGLPRPAPKNSEYKNPLENFSSRFFLDQDGILHIDYLPKGLTINAEYYSTLLVQLKDILKVKLSRNVTKHDKAPAHQALQSKRNWPSWAVNVLITHPILRIWPRRTTTYSLD